VSAPTVAGMTGREPFLQATALWQGLTAALRLLSDEDFAAVNPASLEPVEVPVQVCFGVQESSGQG
jgi:hypothetical protein